MAIMVDHVQMAALTLKKEMPIESRKTVGIVRLRIRQKCTVGGPGLRPAAGRPSRNYQWIAVKSSLLTPRVAE
jgi:hypothetical protein